MLGTKVMVTGGAGFIGSELVRQLAATECRVLVVDNLVNGRRENLEGPGCELLELEVADIRHEERMRRVLRGVDVVFHLACLGVRHSIHSPEENHEVNATGTLRLLIAARDAGVKRFVYVSSSEVYGTARTVPMTEEHPTFPTTVYGSSKLAGECYTRAFWRTYGFPTVIVRPFNAYGPRCHHEGDSGEVIPKFLLRCMANLPMVVFGDGTQTRDFTFVSDTAAGIRLAGTVAGAVGQTINLGNGREIRINELAQQVAAVAGRPPQIVRENPRPGDVLRLYASCALAREVLGFQPTISLEDGLCRLRQWYLELGESPERLLESEVVHNWEIHRSRADG
jgi:UDP-glucose 4-epimerase